MARQSKPHNLQIAIELRTSKEKKMKKKKATSWKRIMCAHYFSSPETIYLKHVKWVREGGD